MQAVWLHFKCFILLFVHLPCYRSTSHRNLVFTLTVGNRTDEQLYSFLIIFSSPELTRAIECTTLEAGRRLHWNSRVHCWDL